MKLMIASDIHGSAAYCEILMQRMKEEDPEKLLLLGDLLYHGPRNDLPKRYEPREVIEMLNGIKVWSSQALPRKTLPSRQTGGSQTFLSLVDAHFSYCLSGLTTSHVTMKPVFDLCNSLSCHVTSIRAASIKPLAPNSNFESQLNSKFFRTLGTSN